MARDLLRTLAGGPLVEQVRELLRCKYFKLICRPIYGQVVTRARQRASPLEAKRHQPKTAIRQYLLIIEAVTTDTKGEAVDMCRAWHENVQSSALMLVYQSRTTERWKFQGIARRRRLEEMV